MAPKDAIEMLECIRYSNDYSHDRQSIALDMAIEALEKQNSKEPTVITANEDTQIGTVIWKKGTKVYKCSCGSLLHRYYKFCPDCGHAIDWSEGE